jgi:DNA polymerase I-like protein with 3'-5' exonuclease and polymerase domains
MPPDMHTSDATTRVVATSESRPATTTNRSVTNNSTLSDAHVDYLTARGVSVDVAIAAGLRSVDAAEGARLLGWDHPLRCGALAIPYPNVEPRYHRLRLDEPIDGARFFTQKGREVPVYVTEAATRATGEIYVVEGPIKALALATHGLAAVGLGGTGTTLTKKGVLRALNSSWECLGLDGRHVTIVFDAGRRTNPNVARDEARLAMALAQANAQVRLADLPDAVGGGDQGPDDYLAEQGLDALKAVLAKTKSADPIEYAREVMSDAPDRADGVASLLDDLPFQIAVCERGDGVNHRVREVLRGARVSMKAWDATLSRARRAMVDANHAQSANTPSLGSTTYAIREGRLCVIRACREGERAEALANFTATIEREVILDDGAEEQRRFEVRGELADGTALPTVMVDASEFAQGRWPLIKWGARANVSADVSAPANLRAAIQELSQPSQVRVYRHTGLREIDGRQVFLHADGAIGVEGVQTQLDGPLGVYRLPAEVKDPREALEMSLSFLDIGPREVTVPLLAATYRAPTSSILPVDATIWVVGRTGSTKSTQVALLMNHDGDFNRTNLTANWCDTAASIEDKLFRAKDNVAVIDDFAPKGSESWDALRSKAETVLRSIGNRSSRGRMHADMTAQAARPPRGLVMSTGEDLPTGESILARVIPVRVTLDATNLARLAELDKVRHRLRHAKAEFITWLLSQGDALVPWVRERFEARRRELQGCGGHLRTPEAVAHLVVGVELLSAFAVTLGVYEKSHASAFVRDSIEALREVGVTVGAEVAHADPVQRFLDVLRALMAQRKITLQPTLAEPAASGVGSECIGWVDEKHACLLPGPTYRVIVQELARARESMPLSEQTVWERLIQRGLLLPGDRGHHTAKMSLGGGRPRVLRMPLWVLDGDQSGDDPGPRGGMVPTVGSDMASTTANGATWLPPPSPAGGGASGRDGATPGVIIDDWFPPFVSQPVDMGTRGAEVQVQSAVGFRLINNANALGEIAAQFHSAKSVALDLRTPGPDPVVQRHHMLALKANDSEPVIVDLHAVQGLGPLANVLRDVVVVGHDLRATLSSLAHHYNVTPRTVWDTALAARLLDGGQHGSAEKRERYFSLGEVAHRELGPVATELDAGEFARVAHDVELLPALYERLQDRVIAAGLAEALTLELAALPAVVGMMVAGVAVDRGRWEALVASRRGEAASLRSDVEAALGLDDVHSHEQLLRGLRAAGVQVERTGKECIAPYRDVPAVEKLMRFRRVDAFVRAPGAGVLAALDRSPDGRVRATLDQLAAPTGRFGCSEPNLLGLEKSHEVRECIVPASGCVFVVADYASIELRVLAHVTGDERLSAIFHEGGDPHAMTAGVLTGKPPSTVTKEERQRAKAVNFGFAFGMGAESFQEYALANYGVVVTLEEAEEFKAVYQTTYPGVAAWQRTMAREKPSEVRSASGRRRIHFDPEKAHCQRLAMQVQGTAADGVKHAMSLLRGQLHDHSARLVLCVHDELVVEVPRDRAAPVRDLVEAMMVEGMARFVTTVPIEVEADIRATWSLESRVAVETRP